jgi:hypothetical protein
LPAAHPIPVFSFEGKKRSYPGTLKLTPWPFRQKLYCGDTFLQILTYYRYIEITSENKGKMTWKMANGVN